MPKPKLPFKEFEWSPELAYAIGLIVTDGNLSKDRRHITMRSSDISLLKTFRSCLNLKNKIGISSNDSYAKKPSYRVQFSNVQLYNWLLTIGITPAKTHSIGGVKIPDRFFQDFLRGHLDGDGSILTYTDRYNTYRGRTYVNKRVFVKFISASRDHIVWLRNRTQEIAGVNGHMFENKPRESNRVSIWGVKYGKRESIKLLQWMYYQPDLPCLRRKALIAKKVLKIIPFEKRRTYTRIKDRAL